ncbi:GRAM protein, partial [Spizaetus tyrannus]|nr:GRAM protein [Spizaetus tyrannus]
GLSPTLQELEVAVLDTQMCNNSRFWNGDIAPTMICFQGHHRGSAPSKVRSWGPLPTVTSTPPPSGGPLVCGKRAAVAGVLSPPSRDVTDPFKPPVATSAVTPPNWIRKTLR